MKTQVKFFKKENLDAGSDAAITACSYASQGHIGIRVASPEIGGLRMQLNADEAEMLAKQLIAAAEHLRSFYA